MELVTYTDASYSPQHNVAVIGFIIDDQIITTIVTNPTYNVPDKERILHGAAAAESLAISELLNKIGDSNCNYERIVINTDHACDGHIPDKYRSKVKLQFVEGHKKSSLKDDIDKKFSTLDKMVRKTLREYVNNIV